MHLEKAGGGKTFSQLSTELQANPTDASLAAQVNSVFEGTTLRGLLLEVYAFRDDRDDSSMGGIAAFILAAVMAVLTIFGVIHLRRVSPTAEL